MRGARAAMVKPAAENEQQSSHAGLWLEIEAKSRSRRMSVREDLSALLKDRFQVEVAGIGNVCRPGRYTCEI